MANAVTYAEDTLGVHAILEKVIESREKLDATLTVIANARDERRLAEQAKEDHEMDIAIRERGTHPEMSAAQMTGHLKQALHSSPKWRDFRDEIRELTNTVEGADYDRKLLERDIEIGCARMNELGGYLFYLGASKYASVANKA
jgi:hypothetical protein